MSGDGKLAVLGIVLALLCVGLLSFYAGLDRGRERQRSEEFATHERHLKEIELCSAARRVCESGATQLASDLGECRAGGGR